VVSWVVSGFSEERELGSGASGRVVAAVRVTDGQRVAIKYLSPRLSGNPQFLAAFRAEAALLRSLDVPYVVRLLEYVEVPGQGAAIVMELIDGVSLHEMITQQGPGSPESALVVLKGSLLGLAAAHALGIVHRDYKPENVLVDATGQSKLTDFGVAARAGQDAPAGGTPLYMAPEQWNGGPATPATDIYAATAVFFECLTGKTPFSGALRQLAAQHAAAAVPVEMVDEPLRELIAHGMAKDPAGRPADASQFMTDLEATAAAAYGRDWEDRGRSHLAGRAAALLLLLLPHGGATGAGTGTTTTLTRLSRAIRTATRAGHAGTHAWLYAGIAAAVVGIAAGSVAAVTVSANHGSAPNHLAANAAQEQSPTTEPPLPTTAPPFTNPPFTNPPFTIPPFTDSPSPESAPSSTSSSPPDTEPSPSTVVLAPTRGSSPTPSHSQSPSGTSQGPSIASRYAQAVLADHPIAYWQFSGTPGPDGYADSSGQGNTLPPGATTPADPGIAGVGTISTANGGTLTSAALGPLTGDAPRTVEAWFMTTTAPGCIFTAGEPGHSLAFSLCVRDGPYNAPDPGAPGIYLATWDADIFVPLADVADGNWHYLALTLTGNMVSIVIDGDQPSAYIWDGKAYGGLLSQPFSLPYTPDTTPSQLGIATSGLGGIGGGLDGFLAEVAIYPSAVPVSDLVDHYWLLAP